MRLPFARHPHAWWKTRFDATERGALAASWRRAQQASSTRGWRRAALLAMLAITLPILLRALPS
ncbi:MAG: hypothetical protein EOP81_14160 [Variovorax sp.]|nr:MAG: hypothetical protein EOP81_14160 [Variovorax sp.]